MPRPACKHQKVRLSLQLTVRAKERLKRLQEMTDADSLSEVIRRALVAYETLLQQQEKGSQLIIRDADGETGWRII